ncbi:hypothetical protein KC986_09675, partial [Proteus mirabilis]|uniref:hypothetical protein n=1 Tax=Proteus mirabilis TaxID=584 RepID=UPI0033151B2C
QAIAVLTEFLSPLLSLLLSPYSLNYLEYLAVSYLTSSCRVVDCVSISIAIAIFVSLFIAIFIDI